MPATEVLPRQRPLLGGRRDISGRGAEALGHLVEFAMEPFADVAARLAPQLAPPLLLGLKRCEQRL